MRLIYTQQTQQTVMSHEQPIHGCQFIEIDGLSHMKYLLAGGGETEKASRT